MTGLGRIGLSGLAVAVAASLAFPPAFAADGPAPDAAAPEPVTVAILGDSLAGDFCRGMRRALDGVEGYEVLCWSHPSSGLTRVDFFDWDATLRDYLSAHEIDVAVATFGMNDAQRIVLPDAVLDFGDEKWAEVYGARMDGIVAQLKQAEVEVVWVGLPTASSRRYSEKLGWLNGIYESHAADLGVGYLSLWAMTSDENGRYLSTLPDRDGRPRPARQSDGIHFSMEGETLIACALLPLLPGGEAVSGTSRHC